MSNSLEDTVYVGVILAVFTAVMVYVANMEQVNLAMKCAVYLIIILLNGFAVVSDAFGIINSIACSGGWFAGSIIVAVAFNDWLSFILTLILVPIFYIARFRLSNRIMKRRCYEFH